MMDFFPKKESFIFDLIDETGDVGRLIADEKHPSFTWDRNGKYLVWYMSLVNEKGEIKKLRLDSDKQLKRLHPPKEGKLIATPNINFYQGLLLFFSEKTLGSTISDIENVIKGFMIQHLTNSETIEPISNDVIEKIKSFKIPDEKRRIMISSLNEIYTQKLKDSQIEVLSDNILGKCLIERIEEGKIIKSERDILKAQVNEFIRETEGIVTTEGREEVLHEESAKMKNLKEIGIGIPIPIKPKTKGEPTYE